MEAKQINYRLKAVFHLIEKGDIVNAKKKLPLLINVLLYKEAAGLEQPMRMINLMLAKINSEHLAITISKGGYIQYKHSMNRRWPWRLFQPECRIEDTPTLGWIKSFLS